MDTFLYIVAAIGIMAYQIWNEKNKKEQRKNGVNRPPVNRIDPNEELHRDLAQMFGSPFMRSHIEEDQLEDQDIVEEPEQQYENIESELYSPKPQAMNSLQHTMNSLQHTMNSQPNTLISTQHNLGSLAYNVEVPVNKTDAETTQLLQDIYDSSEITGYNPDGESQKGLDNKLKSFDPRLFILYSEIAKPKFMD